MVQTRKRKLDDTFPQKEGEKKIKQDDSETLFRKKKKVRQQNIQKTRPSNERQLNLHEKMNSSYNLRASSTENNAGMGVNMKDKVRCRSQTKVEDKNIVTGGARLRRSQRLQISKTKQSKIMGIHQNNCNAEFKMNNGENKKVKAAKSIITGNNIKKKQLCKTYENGSINSGVYEIASSGSVVSSPNLRQEIPMEMTSDQQTDQNLNSNSVSKKECKTGKMISTKIPEVKAGLSKAVDISTDSGISLQCAMSDTSLFNDTSNLNESSSKVDDLSSDSEWETVSDHPDADLDSYNPEISKQGIEIVIEDPVISKKRLKQRRKEIDLLESIRLRINQMRKADQVLVHKVHLLCLLAHGLYVNNIINIPHLQGLVLSYVPPELIPGKKHTPKINLQFIKKLVLWFQSSFAFEHKREFFCHLLLNMLKGISTRKALNRSEYNMMFVIVARSLGLQCRLCLSFNPLSLKAGNLIKKTLRLQPLKRDDKTAGGETSKSSNDSEKKLKCNRQIVKKTNIKQRDNDDDEYKLNSIEITDQNVDNIQNETSMDTPKRPKYPRKCIVKNYKLNISDTEQSEEEFSETLPKTVKTRVLSIRSSQKKKQTNSTPNISSQSSSKVEDGIVCWVEILNSSHQWISIDCVNVIIDKPYDIEQVAVQPVTYVVAYDNQSCIKDVSRRYCRKYMTLTRKLRTDQHWWDKTLSSYIPISKASKQEDNQLEMILLDKPMPSIIADFKHHPLYALKRHILKFEAMYPANAPPLGYIRGEPIYARECIHQLRSRDKWLKEEIRAIRDGEEPYKIVTKCAWDKVACVIRTDVPLELFGYWQTEPYEPPTAKHGKVPRNEYGNVDLFKPFMLPKGTVHLQIPGLNRVAKKLGIDCSPAITGFEINIRNKCMQPVFDGFVVCEEYKKQLLIAWEKEQKIAKKKGEEKREKRIYGNWKKLIKGVLIREKLKLKYKE